jgi:hypothetical protein
MFRRLCFGMIVVCATVAIVLVISRIVSRDATFILIYGFGFPASLIVFVMPLTPRGRRFASWVRHGLWICAIAILGWSVVGFTIIFASSALSVRAYAFFQYADPFLGGMILGILVLVQISGGLSANMSNKGR